MSIQFRSLFIDLDVQSFKLFFVIGNEPRNFQEKFQIWCTIMHHQASASSCHNRNVPDQQFKVEHIGVHEQCIYMVEISHILSKWQHKSHMVDVKRFG